MTTPQRTIFEAIWPTQWPTIFSRFPLFLLLFLFGLFLLGAPAHAQDAAPADVTPQGTAISGIINTDTHWSTADSPVIVTDDLTVMNNATLTIDAGVVVKFNDWWDEIYINSGSSMIAHGDSGNPVVFTSLRDDSHGADDNGDGAATSPGPADWGGIYFKAGSSGSLDYVWMGYGAGQPSGMLNIYTNAVTVDHSTFYAGENRGIYVENSSPTIRNSRFEANGWDGIFYEGYDATVPVAVSGCTFVDNGNWAVMAYLSEEQVGVTLSGNTATGSILNGFGLRGTMTGTVTYDASGDLPFIIEEDVTVRNGASLTFTPGTVIKGKDWWDELHVHGTLIAQGDATHPVVFTSTADDAHGGDTNGDGDVTAPAAANWGGVHLHNDSGGHVLEYVWFGYGAGQSSANLNLYEQSQAIDHATFSYAEERGIYAQNSSLQITDSTFSHNGWDGIYFDGFDSADPVTISGSSFVSNTNWSVLAILTDEVVDVTLSASTNSGSGAGGFGLQGTISGTVTYAGDEAFPFVVAEDVTVRAEAELTIGPGTVLKGKDWWDEVHIYGSLIARGTQADPIVFTSLHDDTHGGDTNNNGADTLPGPGNWGGVNLQSGSHDHVLEHVWFGYGSGQPSANLNLFDQSQAISHGTFAYGEERGIYGRNSSIQVDNSTFSYNKYDGIYFDGFHASEPVSITHSSFISNVNYSALAILTGESADVFLADNTNSESSQGGFALRGTIAGNPTYATDSGMPIIIDDDVTVQAGASLTIEPGSLFKGKDWWDEVHVHGSLTAAGTAADPIVFTSLHDDSRGGDTNNNGAATAPAPGQWGGILFYDGSTDSLLEHIWIGYGGGQPVALVNVNAGADHVIIRNATLTQAEERGLNIQDASPTVEWNHIHHNSQEGIYIGGSASPTVRLNIVENNRWGISANSTAGVAIHYNIIRNNTDHGVRTNVNRCVDARYNYWGNATGPADIFPGTDACGLTGTHAGTGDAVSYNVDYRDFITQLPIYGWTEPASPWFHDSEVLGWAALGEESVTAAAAASVDVQATHTDGTTTILGTGLGIQASLTWDTTTVADGWYDLRAVFRDGGGAILNEATRQVVINNSVIWHSGTLAGDESWAAGSIHVVEANVTVPASTTLTLQPGVTVKFMPNTGLILADYSILNGPATAQLPILLTSFADDSAGGDTNLDDGDSIPLPGDWNGLTVQGSGQANLTAFVEFRYIQVGHSGTLTGNETWNPLFLHRITGDVTVPGGSTLTIQSGSIVKFEANTRLLVNAGATLNAQGTLAQPITFTSIRDDTLGGDTNRDGDLTEPAPGDWRDLNIEGQATLDHVILGYGGGPATSGWNSSASLRTGGSSNVDLSNCHIQNGFYDGILAQGGVLNVANCVVTGHDRGLVAWLSGATVNVVNSTFDDNRIGLLAHGGTLNLTNSIVSHSFAVCVERDINPAPTIRYTDLWCPDSLNVRGFTDPVGSVGNISADPLFKNRDLADYRLRFGSPAVDAADGALAPATDIMAAPRYDDPRTGNTGTPTSGGAYADMGAYELVESAPADIDLIVSQVSGPQTAIAGEKVTLQWTVVNSGTAAARGPWHDGVSLIFRPDNRPQITLAGQVLVGQGVILGPGQQAIFSAEVIVPFTVVGSHYWQITANVEGEIFEGANSANNTTRSLVPVALDLPAIPVDGVAVAGQFEANGASLWYKVTVPANQDVQVRLALTGGDGILALYAAQGSLPTPTSYAQRSPAQATTAATLNLAGGDSEALYYILTHAASLTPAPGNFNLTAQSVNFQIDQVIPAQGGNGGTVTLAVLGNGFAPGSTVRLRPSGGGTVAAQSIAQPGRDQINAVFDLSGAAAGPATVEVVTTGNVVRSLADGFQILAGGSPDFWVELVGPANLRAGRETIFELRWGNRGTVDAPMHLLDVAIPANAILSLAPGGVAESGRIFFFTALADGAGLTVPPGYSNSRPLYVTATTGPRINLDFGAVAMDDPSLAGLAIDWNAIAPIAKPAEMSDARWTALWGQLTTQLGNTWATMLPVLAEDALAINRSQRAWTENGVNLRTALLWEVDKAMQVIDTAGVSGEQIVPAGVLADTSNTHYLGVFLQDYDDKWWGSEDLAAVGDDRKHVTEYVDKQAQIPPGRRTELYDSTSSKTDTVSEQKIRDEINGLASRAKPGETIFFHFSGHGFTQGLSTRNDGLIQWGQLYNALNGSQAGRIVVVLDSCHSGGFTDWLKWVETNNTPYAKPTPGRWNVVAAASVDQTSKDGWFSKPFYDSLDKDKDFWNAWQDNNHIVDFRGMSHQNPQYYSTDLRIKVKDTDGSTKDGTDDGLDDDDPSPPGGSGSTGSGVVGSFDPNEKQTLGFGANGFVVDGEALVYTILFENDPTHGATAPVQELLITDTLSANLDWTTFELTEMGFGSEAIPVPAGHQSYETSANMAGDPYPVQVDAALDPATGEVRWYFASRDVTTQDLPEDPWAGFLPVNDETGKGEGYVSFRIMPKAGLADGTTIYNLATITFDPTYGVNAPIVTNRVTNTLDLAVPTSSVQPLDAGSPATFDVTWAGSDGSGSGIAYYDVYVSVDGGNFSLWQTHVTTTTSPFTGVDGSTYGFYSVATDNVGHRQAVPSSAQVVTMVSDTTDIYLPFVLR